MCVPAACLYVYIYFTLAERSPDAWGGCKQQQKKVQNTLVAYRAARFFGVRLQHPRVAGWTTAAVCTMQICADGWAHFAPRFKEED